ncbi:4-alpha-glucanotransferase [Pseudomonas sp. LRF_L74]|uniref:4-alpha-glucanotransferase n=1 Tax=Pseudomonas sp. LRF_L74 TaxID=3369422 RepID=UPI003F618297
MSDSQLADLAHAAGISTAWIDANGRQQHVSPPAQRALLEALGYPAQSPQQIASSLATLQHAEQEAGPGPLIVHQQGHSLALGQYFRSHTRCQIKLESGGIIDASLDADGGLAAIAECGYHQLLIADQALALAIAPPACPSLRELIGRDHAWGLTAQVYALRRPGDGGLGDMAALEALARSAAEQGADALAISPLHAMFSANHDQYSPYSPSSRLFFNPLHAAPDSLLGQDEVLCAIANCNLLEEWQRLEQLEFIDWPAVASARYRVLRRLHEQFVASAPARLALDFARFRQEGGDALLQHCTFEALHGVMKQQGESGDWRVWPEHYRAPQHAAVERFAIEHAQEVELHAFNQWLIARGLQRAQDAAREAGMGIGLIADLAVGADGAGSQAWARQSELLPSVTVGAPPDILNRSGQAWGVSAFSPKGLRQHGFRAFIEMLRASLAHVGGVRIDHVMGLKRLWVIPQGAESREGAYLDYPFQDLLRLLALEASRHRALVIGEDLGTVPDGLREELARRHLLGMRVLLFEQRDGRFIAPPHWPRDALATTTTHDLPSIRGWFAGRDIDWRLQAGHCTPEQTEVDRQHRPGEVAALRAALAEQGELEHGDSDEHCLDAAIGFIGKTPAPLVLLPLEDAVGELEQANLPGPGNIHPNWRRRWSRNASELLDQADARRRLARLDAARDGRQHD